jgi:hypothetical protein
MRTNVGQNCQPINVGQPCQLIGSLAGVRLCLPTSQKYYEMNSRFFHRIRPSCQSQDRPGSVRICQAMRNKYASWSHRRRWSLSRSRTAAVSIWNMRLLTSFPSHADIRSSVFSSGHTGRVDLRFFRVRSLHGLVAKF